MYDVFYAWDDGHGESTGIAAEPKALIRSGVTLTSTQTFNVDIQAITLTGRITVNGGGAASGEIRDGDARNSTTGDSVALGMLTDASYTPKQIIPGVYDVYYAWDDGHGESSGAAAESASQPGMRKAFCANHTGHHSAR